MTTVILSELLKGINQQIRSQEDLDTHLRQANALVCVGGTIDVEQISHEIMQYYFSALIDILEKACQLSEHVTEGLFQLAKTVKKEEPALTTLELG